MLENALTIIYKLKENDFWNLLDADVYEYDFKVVSGQIWTCTQNVVTTELYISFDYSNHRIDIYFLC